MEILVKPTTGIVVVVVVASFSSFLHISPPFRFGVGRE
jgi:hypothetical protein